MFRERAAKEHGRPRYELELKGSKVSDHGLRRIGLLSEAGLTSVARHYFSYRCRFGERVGTSAGVAREAALQQLCDDGRYRKLPAVIGQLWIDALGLEHAASRNTRIEYRRTAEKIGLTAQDFLESGGSVRRLDFDGGQLLVGEVALEVGA